MASKVRRNIDRSTGWWRLGLESGELHLFLVKVTEKVQSHNSVTLCSGGEWCKSVFIYFLGVSTIVGNLNSERARVRLTEISLVVVNVYTHVGECLDLERTQPQSFECMCTTLWISLIRLIIGWRGWGENCQNGTTDNYLTPLRGQFGCLFLSTSEFVLDSWVEKNYYRAIKVGSCKKSVCLFVIVATNYFETEVFNRKWSHLLWSSHFQHAMNTNLFWHCFPGHKKRQTV